MADIKTLPSAWRGDWVPASFRGARFHVETKSLEDGRRIVNHEFPKKDVNYAEDMGKLAYTFSVRGYCIQYPRDMDDLFQRDYRKPRDLLLAALSTEGPGWLILPFFPAMIVVCPRYRLTEDDDKGGYCVFDMQFIERGTSPFQEAQNARGTLIDQSQELADFAAQALNKLTPVPPQLNTSDTGVTGGVVP